ncbi:MAG: SpoIIE family protein phosphatase [Desulfobacterales bacterium]|nr:SpoIIE family protein phosphatase [Desulfobacterales bacterium]
MITSAKIKILIVDDDSFIRDVLADILQAEDYAVETAEDGQDALARYSADPGIGLVISDMNMPKMGGMELLDKLRGRGDDVPVIILTGNNEISVAINALKRGANDYLLKDENIQETVSISVTGVLEKYELKKQNLQLMADLALKNERLEKERILAQNVQKNILPCGLSFPGFEIGTFYQPSDKIGGDFFDAWDTEAGIHCVMGDVSGHSMSSALIMAVSKGIFCSLGNTMQDPIEIIRTANRMFCDILQDSGMFLSLVYAVFDRHMGQLRIVSAGHNPVFIVNKGSILSIDSMGPVLGWDADDTWTAAKYNFNPGDMFFLYTDGLTEAINESGEEFGELRLQALLTEPADPVKVVEKIVTKVRDFSSGKFFDDLTIFVLKRIF